MNNSSTNLKRVKTLGVAASIMRNSNRNKGENEFAKMKYMNITVITSNKPYGISDGSNPLFDGLEVPKFNLKKGSVHNGHIQQELTDPFCFVKIGTGRCQDGYTKEVDGQDSVKVLVATKAKPNKEKKSLHDREFFISFLNQAIKGLVDEFRIPKREDTKSVEFLPSWRFANGMFALDGPNWKIISPIAWGCTGHWMVYGRNSLWSGPKQDLQRSETEDTCMVEKKIPQNANGTKARATVAFSAISLIVPSSWL
ncbi:hypothetical protein KIW84_014110 [Lathyrus oleraceus]|uniref:Uncharacterized protein n=1 Tax=Pisum sativum TaxID=3888 RepID=A0A9D5GYP3_PEA|nr:hypothetical protein KIW84_014110 [Pisum sativum]